MFLAVGLVDGERVARLLKLHEVVNDVETSSGIVRTHENGTLEWRVDGGHGEVGDNRDSSSTVPPAVSRV